jgi:tRNA U34 5-methylaminomethyl-2-thiouridine-forming methyltransferase MnmC
MNREHRITQDGSSTLFVPELGEHYHSHFGAIQESKHIFIDSALSQIDKENINVLEFGFGTGLNALLSCNYAIEKDVSIRYLGIEKYPLSKSEYSYLNYGNKSNDKYIQLILQAEWEREEVINKSFSLTKIESDFRTICLKQNDYDVVFFDAFAPDVQPHLWSKEIFKKIYLSMRKGGVLTTYTVKGVVRRILKEVGFRVEKIPGPPGKREITRAWKQRDY